MVPQELRTVSDVLVIERSAVDNRVVHGGPVMNRRAMARYLATIVLVVSATPLPADPPAPAKGPVETIVVVRHGEKPKAGLGQLTCQGLNRALMLPTWFAAHFPPPDAIFAPDPSKKVTEWHGDLHAYDYVRPLLTIGPTAIRAGLPIDTQIPYDEPGRLADVLTESRYHHATVYVAWEHGNILSFAKILLARFGSDAEVPKWPNSDYDTAFVFTIDWSGPRTLKFDVTSESLGTIPEMCPGQGP
jgi:hypothetical protein